jgi:hypothetical protein
MQVSPGTNKLQEFPCAADNLPGLDVQPLPFPHKKLIKHRFAFDRFFLATTSGSVATEPVCGLFTEEECYNFFKAAGQKTIKRNTL